MRETLLEAIRGSSGSGHASMHGSAAPALVIDTMTIFNVGNATYLALPASEPISITLPSAANSSLVTVVFWPRAGESDAWLRDQTRAWTDVDDVFSSEFLDGLVVVVPDDLNEVDITASIGILSEDSRPRWWATVPAGSHGQLLPGPYLLSKGRLHRAYKVYDDVNGAFVVATNLGSLQNSPSAISALVVISIPRLGSLCHLASPPLTGLKSHW